MSNFKTLLAEQAAAKAKFYAAIAADDDAACLSTHAVYRLACHAVAAHDAATDAVRAAAREADAGADAHQDYYDAYDRLQTVRAAANAFIAALNADAIASRATTYTATAEWYAAAVAAHDAANATP